MHGGIGASLVGLVAGYWVLDRAQANKANLKRVGNIIGWLVITASIVSAVSGGLCNALGGGCPFAGKRKAMMMDKSAAPMTDNAPAGEPRRK